MRGLVVLLCVIGMAFSLTAPSGAQETVNFASLSGRVLDPQDALVPNATVTARHLETNVVAQATTDSGGRFRFSSLRVGGYEVTVRAPGFDDAVRYLTLTIGGAFDLPIALSVGTFATQVTIVDDVTVLDAARSQIASTVLRAEVDRLPMNGRNFLDLALLVPGVSPANVGGGQQFAETSAVPGNGLSIGSQRNLSNNFVVDGLSANDDAAALSGIPFGVSAIEQFQVITSGGQAELGRALGGFVNVVTKSGTNVSRGDLYAFFRDDALNGANALTGATLPMSQQQFGGSLGGPLRRDRTFYFANVEQRRLDQNGLTTILPASVGIINTRLAQAGYPGSPVSTGLYPNPVTTTYLLGKIDQQLANVDLLSVRFTLYDLDGTNVRGAGGLNAPSASAGLDNRDVGIAVGNTLSLSPRVLNETRGQIAHGDLRALPTDRLGPAVSIAGVASFGTLSANPTGRVNTMYQVVNNTAYVRGAHAFRGGVDFLYNDDTITFPRSIRGAYTFSSLANFLAGTYNNAGFTQTFGATEVSQTNPNVGLYVQDEWKVRPALTVNLGLRYDLQFLEAVNTDTNNLAPRAGFAWAVGPATVIRGGAGMYFDRVPLRAVANALLSAGNSTDVRQLRQISVSLSPTQDAAPVFPAILSGVAPTVTLVNFTTIERGLQNAYSQQGSLEIERQIGAGATASAAYQYVGGRQLLMQINQNVPSCVAAGNNNGCRPNPAYANNNQYSSAGTSSYHGLHVSLAQRPAAWGHYRVSYTLSRSRNNLGEAFFSAPIDPFDLSKDWGRSDGDQRHRLAITGSANLPYAIVVSGGAQYYSSLPLNITSGVTTVQGTAGRPTVNGVFIERNSGSLGDFFSLNARIARPFRVGRMQLEGLVEAFNLTNRRNVVTMNGNFGAGAYPSNPAATFRQVTAVADPRTVQIGLRTSF